MITVGFINELNYISNVLNVPVKCAISIPYAKKSLMIEVKDNYFELDYDSSRIWREEIMSPSSMFGIESCDSISKIIYMIDNNIEDWKEMVYFEK